MDPQCGHFTFEEFFTSDARLTLTFAAAAAAAATFTISRTARTLL
jgi:hypothetical protein